MSEKFQKAYEVPPALSKISTPGQVPKMHLRAANKHDVNRHDKAFAMPKPPKPTDYEKDTAPRLKGMSVMRDLGLDLPTVKSWAKFLDEQAGSQKTEMNFRRVVHDRLMHDKFPPELRRVIHQRAISLYRTTMRKSFDIVSLDDVQELLQKAEPRGGRYERRVKTEKGTRYYYDLEKYHGREDAHHSGRDVAAGRLAKKWGEAGKVDGKEVERMRALHGEDVVKAALGRCGYVEKAGLYCKAEDHAKREGIEAMEKAREVGHPGFRKAYRDQEKIVANKENSMSKSVSDFDHMIEFLQKAEVPKDLPHGETNFTGKGPENGGPLEGVGGPAGDGGSLGADTIGEKPAKPKDAPEFAEFDDDEANGKKMLQKGDGVPRRLYPEARDELDARRMEAQRLSRLHKSQDVAYGAPDEKPEAEPLVKGETRLVGRGALHDGVLTVDDTLDRRIEAALQKSDYPFGAPSLNPGRLPARFRASTSKDVKYGRKG